MAPRGRPAHRSIVAPLAATIAATRRRRPRGGARAGRAASARARAAANADRRFALLPGEPLAGGAASAWPLGQLDLAIEPLRGAGTDGPPRRGVHETRKALKRLRALVRMLEGELGERGRSRARTRRCATSPPGWRRARDAEVMLAHTRDAARAPPAQARAPRRREGLRKQLAADHERAARGERSGTPAARAEVLAGLRRASLARGANGSLSDRGGTSIIEPGLRRIYRDGRRRYRRAARGARATAAAMHEWRKRVKDLRYAARDAPADRPAPAPARPGRKRSRRSATGRRASRVLARARR